MHHPGALLEIMQLELKSNRSYWIDYFFLLRRFFFFWGGGGEGAYGVGARDGGREREMGGGREREGGGRDGGSERDGRGGGGGGENTQNNDCGCQSLFRVSVSSGS